MDNREYKKFAPRRGLAQTTSRVVSRCATATGGEELVIRTDTGDLKTVITSPSSVASMDRGVKLYKRALKSLAKK